jgi:uncharacterized protein (TIGR02147 family)
MIFDHTNYRTYLRAVLAERVTRNPLYSLKAFSKQLGIGHSSLCEVLGGKKNLSGEMALRVSQKLGLAEKEDGYFRLLVQYESSKSPEIRQALLERINSHRVKPVRDLSLDAFQIISSWYHLPILQMALLDSGPGLDAGIAAKRLGISRVEARVAIERLERLELLERQADGTYRRCDSTLRVHSPAPNAALRKFNAEILGKALESVESDSPSEKVIGTETIAFDPEQMEEVRRRVDEFLTSISELTLKAKRKTQVYSLCVQFFNLTKGKKQ